MSDRRDGGPDKPLYSGVNDGWSALSYIISGVLIWGGVGWLLSSWLDAELFIPLGLMVGAAAGVGLVWLRYGRA
jgi:F0F1-type ATP synthase assembly protein I